MTDGGDMVGTLPGAAVVGGGGGPRVVRARGGIVVVSAARRGHAHRVRSAVMPGSAIQISHRGIGVTYTTVESGPAVLFDAAETLIGSP